MSVHCLCARCLEAREDVGFLGIRVVDSSELLCWWSASNPDPLEEQPLLLTAEPSLQLLS